LNAFINETESEVQIVLESDTSISSNILSFYYPRVIYTSGAPEVAGEGSIVQTLEAQALQNGTESSITIRKI